MAAGRKIVRIELTSQQLGQLRLEVFCNQRLSGEQRRKAVRKVLPLPTDGSRVDLYHDGKFVAAV